MTKSEFLSTLQNALSGIPKSELDERLNFYNEMIDDRIEEGIPEEEAIAEIGTIEEIAEQIIADTPLLLIAKEKVKPKRQLTAWEIILIVVGAPLWLSLLVSIFVAILSIYVSAWAAIISLWVVFGSLIICSAGSFITGLVSAYNGNTPSGVVMISACLVCAGVAIFFYFGCKASTKGLMFFIKKLFFFIKNALCKKGVV